jgi:hypothetical protein
VEPQQLVEGGYAGPMQGGTQSHFHCSRSVLPVCLGSAKMRAGSVATSRVILRDLVSGFAQSRWSGESFCHRLTVGLSREALKGRGQGHS